MPSHNLVYKSSNLKKEADILGMTKRQSEVASNDKASSKGDKASTGANSKANQINTQKVRRVLLTSEASKSDVNSPRNAGVVSIDPSMPEQGAITSRGMTVNQENSDDDDQNEGIITDPKIQTVRLYGKKGTTHCHYGKVGLKGGLTGKRIDSAQAQPIRQSLTNLMQISERKEPNRNHVRVKIPMQQVQSIITMPVSPIFKDNLLS